MEINVFDLLNKRPEALLFTIIGLGYLIGKIKIKGVELSPAGGVLFAALFFGHFNLTLDPIVETIGFVFFIYSVGFRAGPRFFSTFKKDGLSYLALALVVAGTAIGLIFALTRIFHLDSGFSAGILGGALTSTPTLAAAQDAVGSEMVSIPENLTRDQVNANITVGYAITYVFGLLGLLMFMRLFPRLAGIKIVEESNRLEKKLRICEDEECETVELPKKDIPQVRTFKVSNDQLVNKPLAETHFITTTGCLILMIKRKNDFFPPNKGTELKKDDIVAIVGTHENLRTAGQILGGEEVFDDELGDFQIETLNVVVTRRDFVGKTLPETGIASKYQVFVDKITRMGLQLPVTDNLKIEKGDHLILTGLSGQVHEVVERLGHAERPVYETDLLTFAFGIVVGGILGTIVIKIGALPLSIGLAGGLLTSGLVIGYLRSLNPTFGRVPRAARFLLMELGMLFFLAGVGLRAGHGLIEGLKSVGIQVFITGVLVTLIPIVVGFIFGKFILKINPVILLGALAGAITSTPALDIVNRTAKSTMPSLGYAGTYAFANILLTLAGQLVMQFC